MPVITIGQNTACGAANTIDLNIGFFQPSPGRHLDTSSSLGDNVNQRHLIKFGGVSSIPANATITGVSLVYYTDSGTSAYTMQVQELLKDWIQDQAHWNQSSTGVNWQAAGASGALDSSPTSLGSLVSSATIGIESIIGNANFIALVQAWVSGAKPNYGLIIRNTDLSTVASIVTCEGSDGQRPMLVVTYTVPQSYNATLSSSGTFPAGIGTNVTPLSSATYTNSVTHSNGVLTLPLGTSTFNVLVPTINDNVYNETRTYSLTINGINGTGSILNIQPMPTVSIGTPISTVRGDTSIVPVTLSAISGLDTTVSFATANSTAISGVDYTAASGTLLIPAGQSSASIVIQTGEVISAQSNFTFNLNLTPSFGDPLTSTTTVET